MDPARVARRLRMMVGNSGRRSPVGDLLSVCAVPAAREGFLARKASDLMSLLAHRGAMRRRGRSGAGQGFFDVLRAVLAGGSGARGGGKAGRRGAAGAGNLLLAGLAFGCVACGYVLGSAFPWGGRGAGELKADAPQGIAPGPIGERRELQPRAADYLIAAAYPDYSAAEEAAVALRGSGLEGLSLAGVREGTTRRGDQVYVLVAYYEGEAAGRAARAALRQVAAPDAVFEDFRNKQQDWPVAPAVR